MIKITQPDGKHLHGGVVGILYVCRIKGRRITFYTVKARILT